MRFFSLFLVILLLSSNATAECREKECMLKEYKYQQDGGMQHTFYYNNTVSYTHLTLPTKRIV